MSLFTVRVEMHNALSSDYEILHDKMLTQGFNREIEGKDSSGNKGVWALPTAEYDYRGSDETAEIVRDKAKVIANSIRKGSWVLVTEVKTRSWSTEKLRSVR